MEVVEIGGSTWPHVQMENLCTLWDHLHRFKQGRSGVDLAGGMLFLPEGEQRLAVSRVPPVFLQVLRQLPLRLPRIAPALIRTRLAARPRTRQPASHWPPPHCSRILNLLMIVRGSTLLQPRTGDQSMLAACQGLHIDR